VDIYMHVLDAYRWWFLCVYGGQKSIEEYPLRMRYTAAEAKAETRSVQREIDKVLRRLRERDLERKFTLPIQRKETVTLRILLLHMAEEELQHRGEMNALLWQLGKEAPVVGFDER
jgi:uncharacterized damage-inducible protein DinB